MLTPLKRGILWGLLLSCFVSLSLSSFSQSQTTCIDRGKPCSKFVQAMVGQYPPLPSRQESAREATFLTFNTDRNRTLRPDKKSWLAFAGGHAAMGLTYYIDHRVTHGARETNDSEIPAMLGLTGLDFVFFKCLSPAIGSAPPIYGIIHYGRDAFK